MTGTSGSRNASRIERIEFVPNINFFIFPKKNLPSCRLPVPLCSQALLSEGYILSLGGSWNAAEIVAKGIRIGSLRQQSI